MDFHGLSRTGMDDGVEWASGQSVFQQSRLCFSGHYLRRDVFPLLRWGYEGVVKSAIWSPA